MSLIGYLTIYLKRVNIVLTKASVKPSLERIEEKLDSISERLCCMSPDCEPDEIVSDPIPEAETLKETE